jgi:hypothetical protein
MNEPLWKAAETVRAQARRGRKTVDLAPLRVWAKRLLNDEGRRANQDRTARYGYDGYGYKYGERYSNGERLNYYDGFSDALESLLHLLDDYSGYNGRGWLAFCGCPGWHDVVKALHAHDDEHGTRHYWRMLKLVNRERGCHHVKYYYGGGPLDPTDEERARAERICARYRRYFGIDQSGERHDAAQ